MSAGIVDIATAKPGRTIPNDHFAPIGVTDEWIRRRTGIASRSWLPDDTPLAEVAAEACAPIVTRANRSSPIDALVLVSTSERQRLPSIAQRVAHLSGLPSSVLTFDMNAACCGFVYGMIAGLSLCDAGAARSVLVCTAEAMSRLIDRTDRQNGFIFADGCSAVLLENRDEFAGFCQVTGCNGEQDGLIRETGAGGIRMDGRQTFAQAVRRMTESAQYLFDHGAAPTVIVGHQANARILAQVRANTEHLGVPVVDRIENVGNTSSASIPLAFAAELDAGGLPTAGRLGAVAYGSGEAWGGVSVDYRITADTAP